MATILVNYGVPSEGFYQTLKGHTLHIPPDGQSFEPKALEGLLPAADAIVACKPVTRAMIEAAKQLKLIVCYGAGYDSIDLEAAAQRHVVVCNIPDAVTQPTAELAFALIMALARQFPFYQRAVRGADAAAYFSMGRRMSVMLSGSTLGIVGMGRIGGRVADFGRQLGMSVLYTARNPKPERDALGERRVPLETLMASADFISLHCPLTPETHGLISRDRLALMKPTAYLINTSRGAVVDEAALIAALQAHAIAGAGLDVFTAEPAIDPALLALDNVILTPHTGSNTVVGRYQMAEQCGEQIASYFRGDGVKNIVSR